MTSSQTPNLSLGQGSSVKPVTEDATPLIRSTPLLSTALEAFGPGGSGGPALTTEDDAQTLGSGVLLPSNPAEDLAHGNEELSRRNGSGGFSLSFFLPLSFYTSLSSYHAANIDHTFS